MDFPTSFTKDDDEVEAFTFNSKEGKPIVSLDYQLVRDRMRRNVIQWVNLLFSKWKCRRETILYGYIDLSCYALNVAEG